jgi:hypothetical protein
MPYSISTLLTRNLHDVFGEATRRAGARQSTKSSPKTVCSTIPREASTEAATRSIESRARSSYTPRLSISANSRAGRSGQWRAGPMGIGPAW